MTFTPYGLSPSDEYFLEQLAGYLSSEGLIPEFNQTLAQQWYEKELKEFMTRQNNYDLVIQLGSQVQFIDDQYCLAQHTRMRTEASAIVLSTSIAPRLMISGGSNFGVRYDDRNLLKPALFTFEAFSDADFKRLSEAAAIKSVLVNEFGLASQQIFAETLSATTEENAEFLKIILRRRPMFVGSERIAILTLLYHMKKALEAFSNAGINVVPLFAEDVLALHEPSNIERVCQYYSSPKGGKQYPVEQIRQLLTDRKTLLELM